MTGSGWSSVASFRVSLGTVPAWSVEHWRGDCGAVLVVARLLDETRVGTAPDARVPCESQLACPPFWSLPARVSAQEYLTHPPPGFGAAHRNVAQFASGWPLPAVRSTFAFRDGFSPGGFRFVRMIHGYKQEMSFLSWPLFYLFDPPHALMGYPTRPIWPYFVANAVFWAACLWVGGRVPETMRLALADLRYRFARSCALGGSSVVPLPTGAASAAAASPPPTPPGPPG